MHRTDAPRRQVRRMMAGAAALLACVPTLAPQAGAQTAGDPEYSVDLATLDAALDCDPFTHPDTEPVLLVHGTFTSGHEQWDWNYAIALRETGHDVCIVSYPNRGLDDMQISAEYVSRAVQRIHADSGRKVDMVGHSQGALMPRWSVKWWPSVQQAVDDFVLLAGPNHGTAIADGSSPSGQPGSSHQFSPRSKFIAALNADDETPGPIDYTSIYTRFDQLVQPVEPPTAALADDGDPKVVNILLQDLCPLRAVDHLTIGTTDLLTQRLTFDALDHDGPASVERAAPDAVVCNAPDQFVRPESFAAIVAQFEDSSANGFPEYDSRTEEPPLRSYATAAGPTAPTGASASPSDPAGADGPTTPAANERAAGTALPATGRSIPLLAVGIAVGIALLLRLGRSKFDD